MTVNIIKYRRSIAAAVLLIAVAVLTIRNTGVQEVHRAQEPVNFAVVDARPAPGDWPWWRGADQSNVMPREFPPVQWNLSDDRGWVFPLSGRGRAALCTWGEQLFVPLADANRESLSLLCLDHETGRMIWQTELHRQVAMPTQPRSAQASMTPACDGQYVFMSCTAHGSLWVTAVDMNGRVGWQREVGPYFSKWGYHSSPAIHKSLVIVAADNKGARINRLVGASYLAALHRQTGEIVWRIHRPEGDSFGTPIVARVAGRDQLLLAGKEQICSYDPLTGAPLWNCRWSGERASNSVAFDDQHVYASTRQPQQELVCIRADGTGDVTRTHLVWKNNKSASDLPSPVVHDGRLYTTTDDGVLACMDAATGQTVWKRRLGGVISASPVIAGQHLYCCNEDGTVFVIRLGGRGELAAEIPLGEGIVTSPVVSQNRLYLRTLSSLRCIASPGESPMATQPNSPRRKL